MNIRFSVDPSVQRLFPSAVSLGTAAREAIKAALAKGLTPVPPPVAGMTQTVAFISPELRQQVLAAGSDTTPESLAGLAYAWVRAMTMAESRIDVPSDAGAAYLQAAPSGLPLSPLQKQMWQGIATAFAANAIGLAEGSTGLGKTRVIAVAAAAAARLGERVIVAVPTLSVMSQLAATWKALDTEMDAVPMLGRGQFIDDFLVLEMLLENTDLDAETREQVNAWRLLKGAADPSNPLGAIPWLRESLMHAAPLFPAELCTHGAENKEAPAETCYQELRAAASRARVVFTTHAMVATHIRLRQFSATGDGLLGKIDTLIVDEAHQLEQVIGDVFSDALSVFRLRTRLRSFDPAALKKARAGMAVNRLIEVADTAFASLRPTFRDNRTVVLRGNEETPAQQAQRASVKALLEHFGQETAALERLDADLSRSLKALVDRLKDERAPLMVQFSPVRGYPSISIGPRSLFQPLTEFWSGVGRAALVSATLYTPVKGGWSAGWTRSLLAIPQERVHALPRFIEPWVYSSPTLHLPALDLVARLTPASDADTPEIQARYYDDVAKIVLEGAATARGGMLVLCTAYAAVAEIQKRLEALGERLIVQKRGTAIGRYIKQFRLTPRSVWIATGPAWTGLDLADLDCTPETDFLLTDVMVQRLPFRMTELPLQHERFKRLGREAIRMEAAFTLRQGIGRAVRRRGSTDRRIWILDGRIEAAASAYLAEPCRRALQEYTHTHRFTLATETPKPSETAGARPA